MQLARKTIHVFVESVNEKSMKRIYTYASNYWRNNYSLEKSEAAFKGFYPFGSDLTILDERAPILMATTIKKDRKLLITGYFPTKPSQTHFSQEYVYEGDTWKLSALKISIK